MKPYPCRCRTTSFQCHISFVCECTTSPVPLTPCNTVKPFDLFAQWPRHAFILFSTFGFLPLQPFMLRLFQLYYSSDLYPVWPCARCGGKIHWFKTIDVILISSLNVSRWPLVAHTKTLHPIVYTIVYTAHYFHFYRTRNVRSSVCVLSPACWLTCVRVCM